VRENAEVFIVEDDPSIRSIIEIALEGEGAIPFRSFAEGDVAWRQIASAPPKLVILDLMLPGLGGLEICRRIRSDRNLAKTAVIMLTALGSEEDVVAGFEAGADDYVTKPFSPAVLMARVKAQLRRLDSDKGEGVTLDGLMLDSAGMVVTYKGREIGPFTAYEFQALELFLRNPGRVFSRSRLLDVLQGGEKAVTERSIDVMIVGLRRKLGKWAAHLETVRGAGYRIV
jgi:two-component system phosphate regulon response regulator PhoB